MNHQLFQLRSDLPLRARQFLNLFPTLAAEERAILAELLKPVLPRCCISISFSRGFGLTASQLGIVLVHRDHPFCGQFETQWNWFTYFYNAVAAHAFRKLDRSAVERVDQERREWVLDWLKARELPCVETGSYYRKSFRVEGKFPEYLKPLVRDGILRLCFKPPIY